MHPFKVFRDRSLKLWLLQHVYPTVASWINSGCFFHCIQKKLNLLDTISHVQVFHWQLSPPFKTSRLICWSLSFPASSLNQFPVLRRCIHRGLILRTLNSRFASSFPFRNPSQFLMTKNLHLRSDSLKLDPFACAHKFRFSSTWLPMSGTLFLSTKSLPESFS